MPRIPDDDLNGIWWVSHTETQKDWPASVVEDLAADLIEARGGSTADVASTMRSAGERPIVEARPMIGRRHQITSHRYDPPLPEFDPRDVEEEVFE